MFEISGNLQETKNEEISATENTENNTEDLQSGNNTLTKNFTNLIIEKIS